jgi:hypothetical protein
VPETQLVLLNYINEQLFGTDSDQNGMLEEIPRSGLSHLGVHALGYNEFDFF